MRRGDDPAVSERTGRPLARRFAYRYTLAVIGFVGLAIVMIFSSNATLDKVDQANEQLHAVSTQATRLQEIASMAATLSTPGAEQTAEMARTQVEYEDLLGQFRDAYLGLAQGKGDSGLEGPPNEAISDFWNGPDTDYYGEFESFHNQADLLTSFLGGSEANESQLTSTNDSLQLEANPSNGGIALALDEAIELYTEQVDTAVEDQRQVNQLLVALSALMAGTAVFVIFRPMGQRIQLETTALQDAERVQREDNERALFRNRLLHGLEGAGNEDEIFGRVAAAMAEALPEQPAELLLVDSNQTHLRQVQEHPDRGAPGCPVDDPRDCVAIKRGQTVRFETSRALDVCPKLPLHPDAPCSAICSPVRFLGQALGVVHVIGPDLVPPDHQTVERLNVLANETGARLGTMRATRQTELQASTDGLTGLPNRRSLDAAATDLTSTGRPFAVAIADLDHFKDLNDTYGHEAGDRALKLFAKTLRSNLRPDDVAARFGGEEFVLLLPNASIEEARTALDRLRVTLAGDIAASGNVPFTASWGLAICDVGESFAEMLQAADEALYAAKRAGRNRVVVAGAATGTPGGPPEPPKETLVLDDTGGVARETDTVTCEACWFENPPISRYCLRCGETVNPDGEEIDVEAQAGDDDESA